MSIISVCFFIVFINQCLGFIPDINEADRARMPPVFLMDHYSECVLKQNGTYCMTQFVLVSDERSELLEKITYYSSVSSTRFNHTKLRHGLCVSQRCQQFNNMSNEEDQLLALEACLNETYWEKYKLKTKIIKPLPCETKERKYLPITTEDIIAAIIFVLVLMLNVIGTVYDIAKQEDGGIKYVTCFSMKKNFLKLKNAFQELDAFEKRLKGLHGARVLTMACVIFLHSIVILITTPEDEAYVENMSNDILSYLLINGAIIVQSFFLMTGLLLAYKIEDLAARGKVTWKLIPVAVLQTYLRLLPSSAIVLLFNMTWLRHMGYGPLWQTSVIVEADSCRINWWKHLLFINNYFDNSYCLVHTWYIAANLQLVVLGCFICVLARSKAAKIWTLSILLVIGMLLPAAHTILQDLDAVLFMTPELPFNFNDSPTFNNVYKRAHTNLPAFIIGIGLGLFLYHYQRKQVDLKFYKKYGFLIILVIPMGVGAMLMGLLFKQSADVSPYLRALYAALIKPFYACCVSLGVIGCAFKIEHIFRRLVEWKHWRVPAKLCYSAYIIHFTLIRLITGLLTSLMPTNCWAMIQSCFGLVFVSFLLAIPFYICVEGPMSEICSFTMTKERTITISEKMKRSVNNNGEV